MLKAHVSHEVASENIKHQNVEIDHILEALPLSWGGICAYPTPGGGGGGGG